jgi:hypothetical protein
MCVALVGISHFNNCNFSKAQMVCSLMMVFSHRNMYDLLNVNFNANLKLFLRLSNCASVGDKTLVCCVSLHYC